MVATLIVVWFLFSSFLLLSGNYSLTAFLCYLVLCLFLFSILYFDRGDILSPRPAFALIVFISFMLPIPMFLTGLIETLPISDDGLVKILIIIIVAVLAFTFGSLRPVAGSVRFYRLFLVGGQQIKASIPLYVFIAMVMILAAVLRKLLHLGEAGIQPSIPFAGYIQYLLFDGIVLLAAWFLAAGLRHGGRFYLVAGLSLMLTVAVTQALLGWRSGIIQVIIISSVVFWYQQATPERKSASIMWLGALILLSGSLMQFGNEIRQARLGGKEDYAKSKYELVSNIINRSQGLTRLNELVMHVGELTFTNGFKIRELRAKDLTATQYIDRELYGVEVGQSHSVGTSGPGGPYLSMGLLGVAGAYLFLGVLYTNIYWAMVSPVNRDTNCLAIGLYASFINILFPMLSGNFGANALKTLFALCILAFGLKVLITRR